MSGSLPPSVRKLEKILRPEKALFVDVLIGEIAHVRAAVGTVTVLGARRVEMLARGFVCCVGVAVAGLVHVEGDPAVPR